MSDIIRCARERWHYPWFCIRPKDHDGPCALMRRWLP